MGEGGELGKDLKTYRASLIVISPKRPNRRLAADVPNGEVDIFVFDFLHVETHCWYCM